MPSLKLTLIAVLMFVATTVACSSKDDAGLIREAIQEGATQAQSHEIGDLLEVATVDFIALPGRYNRRSVKGVLFAAFQHYGQFQINYPRPSVQIDTEKKQAEATIYFLIVSQSRELPGLKTLYDDPRKWVEAAQEKADLYQLKLKWIKHDGGWMVRRAVLEGFKGVGF